MDYITVKEVRTRKEKIKYIFLPAKIHKDNPDWLPPIYLDEWELYNKKKNKSYQYADTVLYLAYKGSKPAGRIMCIINRRYNEIHDEQHGRFCFMDCYNDEGVFHALISRAEEWSRERGMVKLIGPLGFSDKDPQGFQIEGFEFPQFITSANNASYMPALIEKEGYRKKVDLVDYIGDIPKVIPPVYKKVLSRIGENSGFRIVEFSSKSQLKPYIIPVLELMNQTFREIYGFVPLNDSEKKELAARYLPILDPKFIKVVEYNNGLAGFVIAMPDVSEGVKKAKGRILPFGIIRIIIEAKRSRKLLMMLGGIRKEFRGQGLDVMMGAKILESAVNSKMEILESHLVLENNTRMRAEYERIGARVVKKFRIFEKDL